MPHRDSPRLDARIQYRLTRAEKAGVVEQAGVAGMTPSEYCRRRTVGLPVISDTDMTMIREVRRQGGLLKKLHTDSKGAYSAETAAALRAVAMTIKSLAKEPQP